MILLEIGGDPPTATIEGTREEIRALAALLGREVRVELEVPPPGDPSLPATARSVLAEEGLIEELIPRGRVVGWYLRSERIVAWGYVPRDRGAAPAPESPDRRSGCDDGATP